MSPRIPSLYILLWADAENLKIETIPAAATEYYRFSGNFWSKMRRKCNIRFSATIYIRPQFSFATAFSFFFLKKNITCRNKMLNSYDGFMKIAPGLYKLCFPTGICEAKKTTPDSPTPTLMPQAQNIHTAQKNAWWHFSRKNYNL